MEFKVWKHPNLKVNTLTLKDQFSKKKMVLIFMLRSKMQIELALGISMKMKFEENIS